MPADAFDLRLATIERSPSDIASWPITLAITRVQEDPIKGFTLTFDQPVPDRWKWPIPTGAPGDNIQFTVWAFVQIAGKWIGAGFVQMWQGRPMGDGSLPAIFTNQGFRNWWGDTRKLWPTMADYVPQPGHSIGLMVSAGNARLVNGVTSVPERSNVVTFPLPANDVLDWTPAQTPVPDPQSPPGPPIPPLVDVSYAALIARLQRLESLLILADAQLTALDDRLTNLTLAGTVSIKYLGTGAISLKVVKP
jgi:hypothetical protein